MAETKTRATRKGSTQAKRKRAKPRKASTSKATSSKRRRSRTSSNGVGQVESARKAVESTAKQAGHSVSEVGRNAGRAASKAKAPLLAGGAAMAGAAAGLAVGASRGRKRKVKRRPMVKVRSKDLAKATRNVGRFGMDVGQLAAELRRNREQAHGTNGAKRRSPVEVVLEGLTHRA